MSATEFFISHQFCASIIQLLFSQPILLRFILIIFVPLVGNPILPLPIIETVLVKTSLLILDVKFLHHLQSTPLLHEYSGPSFSAMLGSIHGSAFLELYQVPTAIPLESLQWCRILDPSSEALQLGKRKKSQGARSGEYGGWGITVMLFLAKNCETLKDL